MSYNRFLMARVLVRQCKLEYSELVEFRYRYRLTKPKSLSQVLVSFQGSRLSLDHLERVLLSLNSVLNND